MAELVADCPRCGTSKTTFDVKAAIKGGQRYGWQQHYETFCRCRSCAQSTVFVLGRLSGHDVELDEIQLDKLPAAINGAFEIAGTVSIKDRHSVQPPEHLPDAIRAAFNEGATCLAVQCWNAAATMFRMCVDLATRPLLPDGEVPGVNSRTRRDLGLRLPWLFENGRLPKDLAELSSCIREDGNDGAHAGTLTKEDALDLLDFTDELLERMFTEPARLEAAKARRLERRSQRTG